MTAFFVLKYISAFVFFQVTMIHLNCLQLAVKDLVASFFVSCRLLCMVLLSSMVLLSLLLILTQRLCAWNVVNAIFIFCALLCSLRSFLVITRHNAVRAYFDTKLSVITKIEFALFYFGVFYSF